MSVLLTRKATLQAAIEDTYNVQVAVGANDGFLVESPMYTIKPNVLTRDFVRNDLSPMPFIIGRKLASMEFSTELRGNGTQNSGLLVNSPIICRLFQACGYVASGSPTPGALGPYVVGDMPTLVNWAVPAAGEASDVFTATGEPANGDMITVGGETYTWKTALTPLAGEVLLGVSETTALANMAAAINGAAGSGTTYAAGTAANTEVTAAATVSTLTVTSIQGGSVGNALTAAYTPSGASEGSWASANLTGGTNIATNTDVIGYYLTVDTAGASGVAHITVTSDVAGEGTASQVVTSGSPFSFGSKGLTLTPTWTGVLGVGSQWVLWLLPSGITLTPVSDVFSSLTLAMHKDGLLHTMPGAMGTFEITAQAGTLPKIKWTFTGSFVEAVDDANPSPIFERTLPSQVELARLRVNDFNAIVDKFTFNQGNDIQTRPDVSAQDGYNGVRLVSRKPEGGVDPEADLVANNDFWGQFSAAQRMPFQMRVGYQPGNTVWFFGPNAQYTGMTYADRNGILTFDAGLGFARSNGNDESFFFFC